MQQRNHCKMPNLSTLTKGCIQDVIVIPDPQHVKEAYVHSYVRQLENMIGPDSFDGTRTPTQTSHVPSYDPSSAEWAAIRCAASCLNEAAKFGGAPAIAAATLLALAMWTDESVANPHMSELPIVESVGDAAWSFFDAAERWQSQTEQDANYELERVYDEAAE